MTSRRARAAAPVAALAAALTLASALGGCAEDRPDGPDRGAAADTVVVVVSVDGLNPDALRRLGPDRLPAFTRLFAEGAGTRNARSAYESTDTLPNHLSMMTGRPVTGADGHGVTVNEDDGSTVEEHAGSYVPGIFDVAHDAGLTTALLSTKDKFRVADRSWDADHGAEDPWGEDDGRDKVDVFERHGAAALTDRLVGMLEEDPPDLSFLHLSPPDAAGHQHGFMSPAYLRAVREVDGHLGRLLDAIAGDGGLRDRAVVVLTSDHGGRGEDHRNPARADDYTVPFVVWGAGVARGADLYALNPQRGDPGTRRPRYTGPQPVRVLDVAPLTLTLLGLPPLGEYAGEPLRVS